MVMMSGLHRCNRSKRLRQNNQPPPEFWWSANARTTFFAQCTHSSSNNQKVLMQRLLQGPKMQYIPYADHNKLPTVSNFEILKLWTVVFKCIIKMSTALLCLKLMATYVVAHS